MLVKFNFNSIVFHVLSCNFVKERDLKKIKNGFLKSLIEAPLFTQKSHFTAV